LGRRRLRAAEIHIGDVSEPPAAPFISIDLMPASLR